MQAIFYVLETNPRLFSPWKSNLTGQEIVICTFYVEAKIAMCVE